MTNDQVPLTNVGGTTGRWPKWAGSPSLVIGHWSLVIGHFRLEDNVVVIDADVDDEAVFQKIAADEEGVPHAVAVVERD
jgi:hypothetical protein